MKRFSNVSSISSTGGPTGSSVHGRPIRAAKSHGARDDFLEGHLRWYRVRLATLNKTQHLMRFVTAVFCLLLCLEDENNDDKNLTSFQRIVEEKMRIAAFCDLVSKQFGRTSQRDFLCTRKTIHQESPETLTGISGPLNCELVSKLTTCTRRISVCLVMDKLPSSKQLVCAFRFLSPVSNVEAQSIYTSTC